VDYLLARMTEFRKAGASYGQAFQSNVTFGQTKKIAQNYLKGDIYEIERLTRFAAISNQN